MGLGEAEGTHMSENDLVVGVSDAEAVDRRRAGAIEAVRRDWKLWIDGEWVPALAGGQIQVTDPSTGLVVASVPAGRAEDVDRAVAAARRAFEDGRWRNLGALERGRRLNRVADLIERDAAKLQQVETLNNGVPGMMAQFFTAFAADWFRYYAGWCGKAGGVTTDISTPDQSYHAYTLKEPVGVAALIVPWNGPLGAAAMKLATALAAGCSCVLKPAEETPLSALLLGEILQEAGIPHGVVNIVTGIGSEAGAALAAHADVDKVSFTGSTEVGKKIVEAAAGNLKKVSLELGGKSPVVIFDDANLEHAIPGAAMGVFFNTGQVCVAGSRIYVQRGIYDRVVEGLAAFGKGLRIGGGFDDAAQVGPLISAKQLDRVSRMIDAGRADGATLLGGARNGERGFFVEPTVIVDPRPDSIVVREEIFGPVVTAIPFDTAEEAVGHANATTFGLAAAVWTENINRAHNFASAVKAGTAWINCQLVLNPALPFGGYRQSGWGRENGLEGVESFMHTKSVVAALRQL